MNQPQPPSAAGAWLSDGIGGDIPVDTLKSSESEEKLTENSHMQKCEQIRFGQKIWRAIGLN